MSTRLLVALILLAPAGRASDGPTPTAQYRVTLAATWSAATHPLQFPPGPHFSGLVGATHDASVGFWAPGALASPGLQNVAELGSKSPFTSEIGAALGTGAAGALLSGGGIGNSPGQVGLTFTIDTGHPLVTLVSMVAPSPDWFVGVGGLPLLQDGQWVDELVVPLPAWDAGTDNGLSYLSADAPAVPHVPVALITSGPLGNGVVLGTYTFTRLDLPPTWTDLGDGLAGSVGTPTLVGGGSLAAGTTLSVTLAGGAPGGTAALVLGFGVLGAPFKGGTLVPQPALLLHGLPLDGAGSVALSGLVPGGLPGGTTLVLQAWLADAAGPAGWAASNAVCGVAP
jgi:hypothetical protein